MKIHPDGTLEGTAEELAVYQGKMVDAKKMAERVQQRQDARPWKHPQAEIMSHPLLGDATVEQLIEALHKKSGLRQFHVNIEGDWVMQIIGQNTGENHSFDGESIIFIYDKRLLINK